MWDYGQSQHDDQNGKKKANLDDHLTMQSERV